MNRTEKFKVYPPTQLLILLLAQIFTGIYLPVKRLFGAPASYLGLVFIACGLIINLWADAQFKKAETTVKPDERPTRLITAGPFRYSRHPMYLGMTAILIGTAILLGSLSAFIFPLIFFLLIQYYYIPHEEKIMENTFGQLYRDYKKRTRPWL